MSDDTEFEPMPVELAEFVPLPQFNCAFYDEKGEIMQVSTCFDEESATRLAGDLGLKWKRDVPVDRWYYVYDDMFVPMDPQPSRMHRFDWEFHEWVEGRTIDELRAARKGLVEAERLKRTTAVIAYDGCQLDADQTAQANISAKLQEIRENQELDREMPVEMLFWRDADNHMHDFPDMLTFKRWLGLLAITITERGTLLYQWAWGKKAQIDAATTPEEIEAVSLE